MNVSICFFVLYKSMSLNSKQNNQVNQGQIQMFNM